MKSIETILISRRLWLGVDADGTKESNMRKHMTTRRKPMHESTTFFCCAISSGVILGHINFILSSNVAELIVLSFYFSRERVLIKGFDLIHPVGKYITSIYI